MGLRSEIDSADPVMVPIRQEHRKIDGSSPWWFGVLLVLLMVAFAPVRDFGWVFDDGRQILSNQAIRDFSGLGRAFTDTLWSFDPTRPEDPRHTYRPLFVCYLTLARQLFGATATGFHLISLALHALAAWIVWRLGLRLGVGGGAAFLAAGLFALHPVQIQAVAWASATTDPMQMIGLGTALWAWLRALDRADQGRSCWRAALLSALALGAAILSIERAFFFVGVLGLALWWWPPPKAVDWKSRLRPRLPALIPVVLVLLAAVAMRRLATGHTAQGLAAVAWIESLWTAPTLAQKYLELLLLPLQLAAGYPLGLQDRLSAPVGGAAVLGMVALGLAVWWSRGSWRPRFLLAAALLLLAPVLHARWLHPQLLVQDRYLYVPAAFLFLWLTDRVASVPGRVLRAGLVIWLVSLAVLHRPNLMPWRSNLALYTRAVEVAPGHPTFAMNLSNERRRLGLDDPDCALLHSALESMQRPTWRGSTVPQLFNLGNCWRDQGHPDRAMAYYRAAIQQSGGRSLQATYNLAVLQLDTGDQAGLERTLARLRQHFPERAETWRLHGVVAARKGQTGRARQAFSRALDLEPDDPASRSMLAQLPAP